MRLLPSPIGGLGRRNGIEVRRRPRASIAAVDTYGDPGFDFRCEPCNTVGADADTSGKLTSFLEPQNVLR